MATEIPKQSPAPLKAGMLIYPGFTLLDLARPQAVLGMQAETYLVWKTLDPVPSDSGLTLNPTHTFAQVPDHLDVLFVPGGFTTSTQMADDEVLDFLIEAGATVRYVTSVCSGALILGMAGLLDGYRAATHWAVYDVLKAMGIETSPDRVVIDRNRMTGGGVTAGIDFDLTLLAELRGEDVAKITQLMIEYNPKPPFNTGYPDAAGPEMVAMVHAAMGDTPLKTGIEIAKSKRKEQVRA